MIQTLIGFSDLKEFKINDVPQEKEPNISSLIKFNITMLAIEELGKIQSVCKALAHSAEIKKRLSEVIKTDFGYFNPDNGCFIPKRSLEPSEITIQDYRNIVSALVPKIGSCYMKVIDKPYWYGKLTEEKNGFNIVAGCIGDSKIVVTNMLEKSYEIDWCVSECAAQYVPVLWRLRSEFLIESNEKLRRVNQERIASVASTIAGYVLAYEEFGSR